MNGKVETETSKLDWFFLFKRGYTSYGTYVINLAETGAVYILVLVGLLHISIWLSAIVLALISLPLIQLMVKIGEWDYRRGGKKIEVRLHYQNDEVWQAVILALHDIMKSKGLDTASFEKTMQRYGVIKDFA